jgi:hypothetical protein
MVLDVYLRKLEMLMLFAVLKGYWSMRRKEGEGVEPRT